MKHIHSLYRFLTGPVPKAQAYSAARHRRMMDKAWAAVSAFYVVNLYFAYQAMYAMMSVYGAPDATRYAIEPLWPVFYCTSQNLPLVANVLSLLYMGASLLAVVWPRRWVRILVVVTMLEATALKYSFGVLNQKEHWWLWTALIFTFLPSGNAEELRISRNARQQYLDIFSIAQCLLLVFYTMTGYWKLYRGIAALTGDSMLGMFSPDALSYIVADRLARGHVSTFLGQHVVSHSIWGFPVYLWVVYIELFSVLIWLRPALHRTWGIMLILFHIGTWLLMGIPFYLQPPLLAILMVQSPFSPDRRSLRQTIGQLPLYAWLNAFWRQRRS